jgi:2-oxoglutarate dehydrogenase E1 component
MLLDRAAALKGLAMSFQHPPSVAGHAGVRQSLAHARVQAFIDAYKREGYRIADIDPLDSISVPDIAELQPQYHALCDEDVVLSQHRFLDGLGLTSVRRPAGRGL